MRFLYNVDQIHKLLDAVCALTGISMAFLDDKNRFICQSTVDNDYCAIIQEIGNNRDNCNCSDMQLLEMSNQSGKYECHICYAGLYDAAIPLIKNGVRAGSVIMGRIRTRESKMPQFADQSTTLCKLYESRPIFTDEQLESLRILLPNILFESAVVVEFDSVFNDVIDYINNNLDQPLTIDSLCARFHISKNVLYQQFREQLNTTINSYITDRRLDAAKQMLKSSNLPVYIIAEKAGFGCSTYFNRVFKEKTGMTPASYRKAEKCK